ncbi:MAG TPA: phospholipid carrier-dependent glycosyltransferase [Abditibacteriaceae bacterium]|jgi:4-amino-4-deoxy-L-arabinose transferase-like glycosyltransferase
MRETRQGQRHVAEQPTEAVPEYSLLARAWLPLLLFTLALCARLIGLRWGLPSPERWYSYHPDERQIVAAVLSLDFFSGDFNPNFFNYPSLFIYLGYVAHFLTSGFGLTHQITTGNQMWAFAHDVIFSARFVCAVLGAATVPLVYLTAREVGDRRIAIIAAALMALLPGHVQHSHFATVDVPATFFVALSLWLAVRALRDSTKFNEHSDEYPTDDITRWRRNSLMWSAFAAGLAAATKYNGVIVLIAPLIALWLLHRSARGKQAHSVKTIGILHTAPLLLALSIAGFVIGCPYSLLNFREFWGEDVNGFAYELFVHPREGSGEIFQNTGNGWWYHLTFNLPFAVTTPLLCAAIIGAATLKMQTHDKRVLTAPLLAFAVVYFFALGFSQVRFMRYVLPLAPALCVFAALLIDFVATRRSATHSRLGIVLGTALCLLALMGTVDVLRPFARTDARDAAATWLKANATSATVALASDRPWFWSAPLSPQDSPPGSATSVEDALAQAATAGTSYNLSTLAFDASRLRRDKPQYVVMSELEWRDKERLRDANYEVFVTSLNQDYELQQTFAGAPALLPGRAWVPHDFLYTNPQVRVYRLKSTS